MQCPYCGKIIPDESTFCPECGEQLVFTGTHRIVPEAMRPLTLEEKEQKKKEEDKKKKEAEKVRREEIRRSEIAKKNRAKRHKKDDTVKRRLIGFLGILAVIVLFTGIFYWLHMNTPAAQAQKLVQEALIAAGNDDYDTALTDLEEAVEIAADDTGSQRDVTDGYAQTADHAVADGNYQVAVTILDSGRERLTEMAEQLEEKEAEVYVTWSKARCDAGDYNGAITLITEAEGKFSSTAFEEEMTRLSSVKASEDAKLLFQDLANEASGYAVTGDLESLYTMLDTQQWKNMCAEITASNSTWPIVVDTGYGKAGLYETGQNQYMFYCGDYDENKERSGNGSWFGVDIKDSRTGRYYARVQAAGIWANDLPNGQMTEHLVEVLGNGNQDYYYEGETTDGKWNGSVVMYRASQPDFRYTSEFADGMVTNADGNWALSDTEKSIQLGIIGVLS